MNINDSSGLIQGNLTIRQIFGCDESSHSLACVPHRLQGEGAGLRSGRFVLLSRGRDGCGAGELMPHKMDLWKLCRGSRNCLRCYQTNETTQHWIQPVFWGSRLSLCSSLALVLQPWCWKSWTYNEGPAWHRAEGCVASFYMVWMLICFPLKRSRFHRFSLET